MLQPVPGVLGITEDLPVRWGEGLFLGGTGCTGLVGSLLVWLPF